MGYYINSKGGYYEGDKQLKSTEVKQRPSAQHEWSGTDWVESLTLLKLKRVEELRAEAIDVLVEREIAPAVIAVELSETPDAINAVVLSI